MTPARIVAVGDSIIFGRLDPEGGGWVGRLRRTHTCARPGTNAVFNLGIGGDTSETLLERLEAEGKRRNPDLLIVGVGVNDCRFEGGNAGRTKLSLGTFSRNFADILEIAKRVSPTIAVISMVPIDELKTQRIQDGYRYTLQAQRTFEERQRAISRENDVPYIDIWTQWMNMGVTRYTKWLADGLHPNRQGHERILRAVQTFVEGSHAGV